MAAFRPIAILAGIALCGGGLSAALADASVLPDAPGKQEVVAVCTQCHGIDLLAPRRSADEWSQVVSQMVGNGARMSDAQFETIVTYLSTKMTPETAPTDKPAQH